MSSDTVTMRVPRATRDTIKKRSKEQGLTEGELVSQQFTSPQDPKIGPLKGGMKQEQGTIFLSSTGSIYKSPRITVAKIKELLENPYIVSKLEKRSLAFFPDRVKIEALDPKQNIAPDETKRFQNMCEAEDVRLNERVLQADRNVHSYGPGIYNPIWARKGGEIYLQKLRHLPSWSFDTSPVVQSSYEIWSPLLKGIILGADGTPEYWQRKNSTTLDTEQITNVMIVKDPKSELLAGDSKLIPLVQIIEMIKYFWNTDMQVLHRSGAPIFFLKIVNPRSAEERGGVSDVDYGNMILQGWSKDKQYQLRDNMEIIGLPISSEVDLIKTHDVLSAVIDDYFSISNMIQKNGTLIGGSSIPELQLLNQAARGLHNWLLAPFENLLNQYFVLNGYPDGWTVRLTIPIWEEDKTQQKHEAARIGIEGQCVDLDDLRQLLDLEPADEKKKTSITDFWASRTQSSSQFTRHVHQFSEEGDGEPLDPVAKDVLGELDKELDELANKVVKAVVA